MVLQLNSASDLLSVLGHPGRLSVLRLLARRAPEDVRAGELADILDMRPNTLSVYVAALERTGFVVSHRIGRSIRYSLLPSRMSELTDYLTQDCLCGRPVSDGASQTWGAWPSVANVLFLCRQNDSRSVIAETLLKAKGAGRFQVFSAGAAPEQEIPVLARRALGEKGFDVSQIHSNDCAHFRSRHAVKMDVVITLCDAMANEDEPGWPGSPLRAHWGTMDPMRPEHAQGTDPMQPFRYVFDLLAERIQAFIELPFQRLDRVALQSRIDALAHLSVPDRDDWAKGVMRVS